MSPIIEMLVQAYSLILNETERTISGHYLSNSNFFIYFLGYSNFVEINVYLIQVHKYIKTSFQVKTPSRLSIPPPLSVSLSRCVCVFVYWLSYRIRGWRPKILFACQKRGDTDIIYCIHVSCNKQESSKSIMYL